MPKSGFVRLEFQFHELIKIEPHWPRANHGECRKSSFIARSHRPDGSWESELLFRRCLGDAIALLAFARRGG